MNLRATLVLGIAVLTSTASATKGSSAPIKAQQSRALVTKPRGGARYATITAPITTKDKSISLSVSQAVTSGVVLAFNSGFINGCCLAGAIAPLKQAVAAVTGAWTTSALSWANGDTAIFQRQMAIIASYAGGSAIAGLLEPNPTPFKVSPSAGPTFMICSLFMYLSSRLATGKGSKDSLWIYLLAAMANGAQNSVSSVSTGNLARTAHYSGMTSDMGTFLGQYLRGNKANYYRLKTCLALAIAFWGGGFISFFVTQKFESGSLLFSAVFYALIGAGLIIMQS